VIPNFLQESLISGISKNVIYDCSCQGEMYLTIKIEGLPSPNLMYVNNEEMNGIEHALCLANSQLRALNKIYGKKYVFLMPQFCIRPKDEPYYSLKVGLLSKERWKKIKKNRKVSK